MRKKIRQAEKDVKRLRVRAEELEQILSRLYEEHLLNRIPSERYETFMAKYESEKTKVTAELAAARDTLESEQTQISIAGNFIEVILGYADLKELSAPILNELIDRIEVGRREVINGEKTQSIRILYKQIGYVEEFSPEELFGDNWAG